MGAIAIDEPFFVQLSDKNRFRIVATQQKWSRSGRRTALHVLAPVPILLLLLLLFLLLALQLCPPIYQNCPPSRWRKGLLMYDKWLPFPFLLGCLARNGLLRDIWCARCIAEWKGSPDSLPRFIRLFLGNLRSRLACEIGDLKKPCRARTHNMRCRSHQATPAKASQAQKHRCRTWRSSRFTPPSNGTALYRESKRLLCQPTGYCATVRFIKSRAVYTYALDSRTLRRLKLPKTSSILTFRQPK